MSTLVIYACKIPESETFLVEVQREVPCCPECETRQMVKLGTLLLYKKNRWYRMELWRCVYCGAEESCFPGSYGSDEVEMLETEYADHVAHERHIANLFARYGTDHPASIRDYWLKPQVQR